MAVIGGAGKQARSVVADGDALTREPEVGGGERCALCTREGRRRSRVFGECEERARAPASAVMQGTRG